MNLISWLDRNFFVRNREGAEFCFPCPQCDHRAFYFNISKRVGYCHRASCGWKPSLEDLVEIVGYAPDDTENNFFHDVPPDEEEEEIALPSNCLPLMGKTDNGQYQTNSISIMNDLYKRGVTHEEAFRWDIRIGTGREDRRIYVPVYDGAKLVHFVSRVSWSYERPNDLRYKYAVGSHPGKYLFGWAESAYWDTLTLVENTFNSIWLRKDLNCSTNFGSHLSKIQVRKIFKSKVKTVVLLWDEGAEDKAEKAVRDLHTTGVNACYCAIKGQPDDHPVADLLTWVQEARKIANLDNWYKRRLNC